jgi:hypothetical protein
MLLGYSRCSKSEIGFHPSNLFFVHYGFYSDSQIYILFRKNNFLVFITYPHENFLRSNSNLITNTSIVKRSLERSRRRWVDNIRMNLGEVEWVDVDWIGLVQDRNSWRALVNSVLNLRVP